MTRSAASGCDQCFPASKQVYEPEHCQLAGPLPSCSQEHTVLSQPPEIHVQAVPLTLHMSPAGGGVAGQPGGFCGGAEASLGEGGGAEASDECGGGLDVGFDVGDGDVPESGFDGSHPWIDEHPVAACEPPSSCADAALSSTPSKRPLHATSETRTPNDAAIHRMALERCERRAVRAA